MAVDVLRASLGVVEEAIADGIDVRGFFHWTGVDNYEWDHGFEVPFGLFDRNREPRASAALLAARARGRSGERSKTIGGSAADLNDAR